MRRWQQVIRSVPFHRQTTTSLVTVQWSSHVLSSVVRNIVNQTREQRVAQKKCVWKNHTRSKNKQRTWRKQWIEYPNRNAGKARKRCQARWRENSKYVVVLGRSNCFQSNIPVSAPSTLTNLRKISSISADPFRERRRSGSRGKKRNLRRVKESERINFSQARTPETCCQLLILL